MEYDTHSSELNLESNPSTLLAGRESWLERRARKLVLNLLALIENGVLIVREDHNWFRFGAPDSTNLEASIVIHDPVFWERVAWGGSIGAAEAYCDGCWSSPDLVSVVRVMVRNRDTLESMDAGIGALTAPLRRLLHNRRSNTKSGSLRNISAHYDTGNEFFSSFLDSTLTYSCAIFPDSSSTLETAQQWKLETICNKLKLGPKDHLLELGTGWGGLAIHAARKFSCRVTTTTISKKQFEYAVQAIDDAGLSHRVDVLRSDYRDLPHLIAPDRNGRFDKLVSIEMIEAVGHRFHPDYFDVINRMLKPDGLALLQTITIPDQKYEIYRRSVDFIQRYIFPGGLVPSMTRIQECIRDRSDLRVLDVEDLTSHYARTLQAWSNRFQSQEAAIADLGLSKVERRKWQYYFGYCEGGFRERAIGDYQILLGKPLNRRQGPIRNLS